MTFLERTAPALAHWRGRRIARRGWLLAIVAVSALTSMAVAAVFVAP
jgi:hypothetical protein